MAETMAQEMSGLGLGLGGLFAPSPDSPWATFSTTPKNKDDSAAKNKDDSAAKDKDDSAVEFAGNKAATYFIVRKNKDDSAAVEFAGNKAATYFIMRKNKDDSAVEAPVNKAAVAGSGLQKAASWSDPAGNKAASASSIEAAASSFEPAARVEGKTKAAVASSIEPAVKAEGKPKPAVISTGIETVGESFIQYLRTRPMRRSSLPKSLRTSRPWLAEACQVADAMINELQDVYEDILRQHDEKGYALVRVERLDNGKKRWFRLPVEETA